MNGWRRLRLRDTVGVWFFLINFNLQLQLNSRYINTVINLSFHGYMLHSPHWKQHSLKPVVLASIARAERSTAHADVNLRRLPPRDFSRQKSDLGRKIQCHRLWSLCAAAASSKWRKLFRLAFTVREKSGKKCETWGKNDVVSTFWPDNFLTRRHFEKLPSFTRQGFCTQFGSQTRLNRWA